MNVVKFMSIFWMIYGVVGVFGFQIIPYKFQGHSWTKEYTRKQGITWILLGIPYFLLSIMAPNGLASNKMTYIAIIVAGIPSFIYSILIDRKYKALLKKEQDEIVNK